MEKINNYTPTPFILDCFCVKCCSVKENEKKPHIYKLYGVITHVGATMSVGHYIAYTCSLDVYKSYLNCPKDKNKKELQHNNRNQSKLDQQSNSNIGGTEKNSGRMKKIIFGRSKASSSGDMTKNIKNNLNGVMNKIVNGTSDKVLSNNQNQVPTIPTNSSSNALPTSCPGLNCCGIHAESIILRNSTTNILNGSGNGAIPSIDYDYGNGDRNNIDSTDPIWYMCDDDKIKAMSQDEFESLLASNNKVQIRPYLLFYARVNVDK